MFQKDSDEPIHRASSQNCSRNLCKWAVESKNWVVHARLNTASDAEAGDVHYHISCYTKLKNEARAAVNKSSNAETNYARQQYDPLVFAQLVAFVQFNNSAFKLADLRKLYDRRLVQLDSDWIGSYVHPTRFKEHLLQKLGPDWSDYTEGRDIYISHKKTVGAALAQASRIHVSDDEAQKIVEVGLILCQHILQEQKHFNGSFDPSCLTEPVSKPLLTLLDVLLEGSSSIEDKVAEDQASISARFSRLHYISAYMQQCCKAIKQCPYHLPDEGERNTISSLCGIKIACKRSSKRHDKYFSWNGYVRIIRPGHGS